MRLLIAVLLFFMPIQSLHATSPETRFEMGLGILDTPIRLALGNGLVYVCDTGLKAVVAFDRSGRISGRTAEDLLASPTGIAVSPSGRVYVSDSVRRSVVSFGPDLKNPETVTLPAELSEPFDIAFDARSVLNILDRSARSVHQVSLTGRYLGRHLSPGVSQNQLSWPLSIERHGAGIAISDAGLGKVIAYSMEMKEIRRFGLAGNWPSSVRIPADLFSDTAGNLFIADYGLSDVSIHPWSGMNPISWGRYGKRGNPTDFFKSDLAQNSSARDGRGYMNHPSSVATDGEFVFVADTGNKRILVEEHSVVMEQPRLSHLPFASGQQDMPQIVATPSSVDFGHVVAGIETVRTVGIFTGSTPCATGSVSISGNYYDVEPKRFVGSSATLYIRHKPGSQGVNNATLSIELAGSRTDITVTGLCTAKTAFSIKPGSDRPLFVSGEPSTKSLEVLRTSDIAEKITVSVGKIAYKTPWAKTARGVEELVLSTLSMSVAPGTLDIGSQASFKLTATQAGIVRPGVYTARITATTESGKHKAAYDQTIVVAGNGSDPQSTLLLETFTAHWCEPCGYQREAGYRIWNEYGPRVAIPVAYHVMDDADLGVSGLTRPEHFELFGRYGGEGVPLNVYDGEVSKNVASGKQLAHDRIRGRKYSGTTVEYWKMRGDLDLAFKKSRWQMNVSGSIDGAKGRVLVETPGYNYETSTENELMVLLTEDDIEHSSTNGEQYHHLVVRLIASKHSTSFEANGQMASLTFEIPKMPEGYEINPDKARLVAFLKNKKSGKIVSTGWFDLTSGQDFEPKVFVDQKVPEIANNSITPVKIHIANPGMAWRRFKLSASSADGIKAGIEKSDLFVGSNSTISTFVNIDTTETSEIPNQVNIALTLEGDNGLKYSTNIGLDSIKR